MKKLRYNITKAAFILFILQATTLQAQSKLNFGLFKPQDSIVLPKSNGKIDLPRKKIFLGPQQFIIDKNNRVYELNKHWVLTESDSVLNHSVFSKSKKNWQDAIVPGTVLTSLVNNGVYPDPYIGLNNMYIPEELSRKDWWYKLELNFINKIDPYKITWLNFEGINYRAEVWINGKKLGKINGAFLSKNFDISSYISTGINVLVVHIIPPPNPGIPHEQSKLAGMGPNGGQLALDGPTFISSEGWDWIPGIRDRNIGIWQPVKLSFTNAITVEKPQIISDLPLPDTNSVKLIVKTTIKNHSNKSQLVNFNFQIGDYGFKEKFLLNPMEEKKVIFNSDVHSALAIQNPKLWWPNGYGNQYLYNVYTSVSNELGIISDSNSFNYGIRELSYEVLADTKKNNAERVLFSPTDLNIDKPIFDNSQRREVEKRVFIPTLQDENLITKMTKIEGQSPYLIIYVNGKKIFCRGGNWGMDDGMKRTSREKLEPAFQLHKHANFNMIRNWTGESTEDIFFQLADEYGMLVWNDFWISTEGYNLNPLDENLFLENSLDVIKRFRNHASIAIWCPRNEGYAPLGIEYALAKQIANEDGTRFYIGNSREINLRPSGDWAYIEKPIEYFNKYAFGFSTEIGTFSIPTANTIKKFLKKEDWWPINDAWHYHDLHSNNQNLEGYLKAIDKKYGKSNSLDDFAKKAQLLNYDSYRTIFESWNSKIWNNTSGVLLWMTHPAWPSMIWQTYSYDFESTGAFFGSKKACEPIHIQFNLNDSSIGLINTTLNNLNDVYIEFNLIDINGKMIDSALKKVTVASNSNIKVNYDAIKKIKFTQPYLLRLKALKNDIIISENEYWLLDDNGTFNNFNFTDGVNLRIIDKKVDEKGPYLILKNMGIKTAIGIKLNELDELNNIVLPSFFSEGYFTLFPSQTKKIYFTSKKESFPILIEGYNFTSQQFK